MLDALGAPRKTQESKCIIKEAIINRVAEELDISQQQVREMNIFGDLAAREKCASDPRARHRDVSSSVRHW